MARFSNVKIVREESQQALLEAVLCLFFSSPDASVKSVGKIPTEKGIPMAGYYKDFRDYLQTLEEHGKLKRITRQINKDTEMHPLVRLQFRGLLASERKAFFFENVVDVKGRKYGIPVAVGCMAASREIYALGMQCAVSEISTKWTHAQVNPVKPKLVDKAPVQEVVRMGEELENGFGLDSLPIPISTPVFDHAPYTSASHFVSRDPRTGIRNLGNYRGQIKSPTRIGCFAGSQQGIASHWRKWKELGKEMDAAIVIGVTPNLSYTATARIPEEMEEYAVAGGIAGEAVEVVRCKTVSLEVPANAEIVIEGKIPIDTIEMEGPFGEFPGFMAQRAMNMFMNVTCITHRRSPIYVAFISQFPPSESSMLRGVAREEVILKYLSVDCELKGILQVALHEPTGSWGLCVVKMDQKEGVTGRQVMGAMKKAKRLLTKLVVIVDADIDARDADAVNWAMSYRMQPKRDTEIVDMYTMDLDCSLYPPGERKDLTERRSDATSLIVDATRKWPYPPVSLPAKTFMEQAIRIWKEEGMPELQLREPWFGYSLGYWTQEDEEEAELALKGEHFKTGEKQKKTERKKV
jgi:4-hydroxy-3-polyprenylbenzoate decarboxylase